MAKHSAWEVMGEGGDTIFVTAREDDQVCLTCIESDGGQSVYIVINKEAVEHLIDAMREARDAE